MFLVPLVCYSVLHRPDQDVVVQLPLDGFQFLSVEPKGNGMFSIPTVCEEHVCTGSDPGFFSGGSVLVSCSTSTPINHIVFFPEYQLY